MVADQYNSLDKVRSILSVIVYPIHTLVNLQTKLNANLTQPILTYKNLSAQNDKLKQQQLITSTKLLKFAALEKENIRLRALLKSPFALGEQFLIAQLVSVNMAPYKHVVLVNKGSILGIYQKQPVMDVNGVVGQVVRVLPFSAEVILITDPSHGIPVQVNRNGLRTIAMGSGMLNRLNLPFLPNNADIKVGDLLVTSGLGDTFPQGYPVAVVDTFEQQPDKSFANAYATPKATLDRNRELLMVWSKSYDATSDK